MYVEDLKRGPNKDIGPKDIFEMGSTCSECLRLHYNEKGFTNQLYSIRFAKKILNYAKLYFTYCERFKLKIWETLFNFTEFYYF